MWNRQCSSDVYRCNSGEQLGDDTTTNEEESDQYYYDLVFDSLCVNNEVEFLAYIESGPNGAVAQMWNHLLRKKIAVKVEPFSDSIIISNWTQMRHPNILPLLDMTSVLVNREDLTTPLEWTVYTMPLYRGSLLKHLYSSEFYNNARSFVQAREWISQIASGMSYLHEQGLYHLDVKTDNVLLSDRGKAVLGDFTFLTKKTYVSLPGIGCPQPYQPPEATCSERRMMISEKVDLWAFAILVLNIMTSHELCCYGDSMDNSKNAWLTCIRPFLQQVSSTSQLFMYLQDAFPSYSFTYDDVMFAKDFLRFVLKVKPSQRPTAHAILGHYFLTHLDHFGMVKQLSRYYLQIPEHTIDHLFLHWWEGPKMARRKILTFETKQSSVCYCYGNTKLHP